MEKTLIFIILAASLSCGANYSINENKIQTVYPQSSERLKVTVYCNIMDENCNTLYFTLTQAIENLPRNAVEIIWKNHVDTAHDVHDFWFIMSFQYEECFSQVFDNNEFWAFVKRFYALMTPRSSETYRQMQKRGLGRKMILEIENYAVQVVQSMNCDVGRFKNCISRRRSSGFVTMRFNEEQSLKILPAQYVVIAGEDRLVARDLGELPSLPQLTNFLRKQLLE